MKSPIEQETYIHWNAEESRDEWIIYSCHLPTIRKLKKLGYLLKREVGPGVEFALPERCVKVKDLKEGGWELI